MTGSAIDLQVPDLATLHQRRSEKWSEHEPDVLASTVAEMDFPLAPELSAALHVFSIDGATGPGPAFQTRGGGGT